METFVDYSVDRKCKGVAFVDGVRTWETEFYYTRREYALLPTDEARMDWERKKMAVRACMLREAAPGCTVVFSLVSPADGPIVWRYGSAAEDYLVQLSRETAS